MSSRITEAARGASSSMPEHGACQPTQPVRHSHASRIAAPAPPSEPHAPATPEGRAEASGCTEWRQARVATHGISVHRSPHHHPKPTLSSEHPHRVAAHRRATPPPFAEAKWHGSARVDALLRREKPKKLIFSPPPPPTVAGAGRRRRSRRRPPPAHHRRGSQHPSTVHPARSVRGRRQCALLGRWALHHLSERAPTSL